MTLILSLMLSGAMYLGYQYRAHDFSEDMDWSECTTDMECADRWRESGDPEPYALED